MNIDYEIKTDNDGIDFEEVAEILHFHGLSDLDTETQKKVFLNSYAVVYLISEGKIIGLGRAISDGVCQAAIYNIAVRDEYRGNGLGKVIVDEILKHVAGEVRDLQKDGSLMGQTRLISVYSLADNQYQMPFAMTLASILSENERALFIDFQENSGLSRMFEQSREHNLDELLVMAESGRYSTNRINSCIGHSQKLDYVYPIDNTENLCEINTVICNNLLQMLGKEMHYDCIVFNMGTRFKGFFDRFDYSEDS